MTEIVLRKVGTKEIVFKDDDINKVMEEFKKYPLFTVSVEQLPTSEWIF